MFWRSQHISIILSIPNELYWLKIKVELQLALNKVYKYCMMFKLSVNTTKQKILFFLEER